MAVNAVTGAALPASTWVMQVGAWIADKQVKNVNNDLSVTLHTGDNKLTLGYYLRRLSSRDTGTWETPASSGDQQRTDPESHSRRMERKLPAQTIL